MNRRDFIRLATIAAGASVKIKTDLGERERAVVYRWDAASGVMLDAWATEELNIYATPSRLVFSPDGRRLAFSYSLDSASCLRFSAYLTLWDAQTGEMIPTQMSSGNNTFDVVFSPDNALMAVNEVEDACVAARSTVFVYNKTKLQPDQLPKSMVDLEQPAWKGRWGGAPAKADFRPSSRPCYAPGTNRSPSRGTPARRPAHRTGARSTATSAIRAR